MSESKSLAESLFEDLLNETPNKTITIKNEPEKTEKTISNPKNSYNVNSDKQLSNLLNFKLIKKIKKCRVRLPKIGQKKLVQMIEKTIKKNNKKNNTKNFNKSNDKKKNLIGTTKKSIIHLPRIDVDLNNKTDIITTRKRKNSDSQLQSSYPKRTQQKLYIKLDSSITSMKKNNQTSKQTSASPTFARQSLTKKSPAKKTPMKISQIKNTPIKKSPAKKTPIKKSPANNTPAKKSPAKKTISPIKQSERIQKKLMDPKILAKCILNDTFSPQFFKCRVRINKVRSLDNLNVTDLEVALEENQKRKLKKKTKGLNKSVSFVETVEVFGESDTDENTPDLNKDIIELDALLDENNDGAGGDDGNLAADNESTKKSINFDDIVENGNINENVFTVGDDLIMSTPKEKLNLSAEKISRIRKSFSPLKTEEDQQSPRSKLLRKGDEKIVRNAELLFDDDNLEGDVEGDQEEDVKGDNVNVERSIDDTTSEHEARTNFEKDSSPVSLVECEETEELDNNTGKDETVKSPIPTENIAVIGDDYEVLSSDDSKDFLEAKNNESDSKSNTNADDEKNKQNTINEIVNNDDDDEDDDYYLPKPKNLESDVENTENKQLQIQESAKEENNDDDNNDDDNNDDDDDDIETIDKIMTSVREVMNESNDKIEVEKKNCNDIDEDSDIFHEVVESIDMLNTNIISNPSPVPFGEELKLSEDESSRNVVEKDIRGTTNTTTTDTITLTSTSTKFSFNTFLKSSIQTIKTKIMSPKRASIDDISVSEAIETTKLVQDTPENSNDIPPPIILSDETDDESALLGDPILGGREMSY